MGPLALRAPTEACAEAGHEPSPSSPPEATEGGSPRALGGPRPDGGLTLRLHAPVGGWALALRALATGRPKRDGEVELELPDGEVVRALVGRGRGAVVGLEVDGEDTRIELYGGGPGRGASRIDIIAGRRALWAGPGLDAWVRRWLDAGSWLGLGKRCASPADARSLGWHVERIDTPVDLVGIAWRFGPDAERWRRRGRACTLVAQPRQDGGGHIAMHAAKHGVGDGPILSICVSAKTEVIRELDRVEPRDSLYAPTWGAAGWDGISAVSRVEVRARGAGLNLRDLDLTDPAALTPENIAKLWAHGVATFELLDDSGEVDARWLAVQEMATMPVVTLGPSVAVSRSTLSTRALADRDRGLAMAAFARFAVRKLGPGATREDLREVVEAFATSAANEVGELALMQARRDDR